MEIEFLGTGTSTGVPQIGCKCEVCTSADPRDNRLRTSAIVRTGGHSILIDCGPDFRTQMLRASSTKIDALLLTHVHYDHAGGIDDLRPYCYPNPLPVYAKQDVFDELREHIPYCFPEHYYPGAPVFEMRVVGNEPFDCLGTTITPIEVIHRKPILGFRIGSLAYITDAKSIPSNQLPLFSGVHTLVINALRHEPHPTHQTLEETLEIIKIAQPKQAFLLHMSHHMGLHEAVERSLPANVHLAYDQLIVSNIPD